MKRLLFTALVAAALLPLSPLLLQTTGAQPERVRVLVDENRNLPPVNMHWDIPQQPTAETTRRVPAAQDQQLKQIMEGQEKLAQQYNQLEAQKVIVAQRAALELGLTAKQLDGLELVVDAQGFFFRPVVKKPDPATPTNPKE